MGTYFYFKARLKSLELLGELQDILRKVAEKNRCTYTIVNGEWDKPMTARFNFDQDDRSTFNNSFIGHFPLKGIVMNIHPELRCIPFLFDSEGNLRDPIEMVHQHENPNKQIETDWVGISLKMVPIDAIRMCTLLLRYVGDLFLVDLEVADESEYWYIGEEVLLHQGTISTPFDEDCLFRSFFMGSESESSPDDEDSTPDEIYTIR